MPPLSALFFEGIIRLAMIHASESAIRFVSETPEMHLSAPVQDFIRQEMGRPSKNWVQDVILNRRESDSVKLRRETFVLLPDINANRRQMRGAFKLQHAAGWHRVGLPRWAGCGESQHCFRELICSDKLLRSNEPPPGTRGFNWLALLTDSSIRSIRDLRGEHVGMLEDLYKQCTNVIKQETGAQDHDIMAYVNYPPSVYRLHVHFGAPFVVSSAFDAFRMHSLSSIINNLKLNPEYYAKSTFRVPVHATSELYRALSPPVAICE